MKKIKSTAERPMTFTIEGEGEFTASKIPKCVTAMVAVLKSLEDGKLLRRRALASRVDRSEGTIDNMTCHPLLAEHKITRSGIVYFGNKTTIKAAREQFSL